MSIEFRVGAGLFALVPLLCACSRAGTPVPISESAAPPAGSGSPARASPGASATAAQPTASPPAPAPPSPLASAPANPWTTADECSRFETASEYQGLSAEDRARSRSTCETKEEFRAFVAPRQACSSTNECTIVSGACPFGCYVPVTKSSAAEVTAKLESLGARLDKAGHRCVYRCMAPPSGACVDGRCAAGPR